MGAAEGSTDRYRLAYIVLEGVAEDEAVTLSHEHEEYAWVTLAEGAELDLVPGLGAFLEAAARES
jgi:hypothetical protein